jgi:hypothetical protein
MFQRVLTAFSSRMVIRDAKHRVISPIQRTTESIGEVTALLNRHGTIRMYACDFVGACPIPGLSTTIHVNKMGKLIVISKDYTFLYKRGNLLMRHSMNDS